MATEKAVFMNMCMIYDENGNILVEDRKESSWSGVAFPGGHVELKEAFSDSVIREMKEETGLTIEAPLLCGIKQYHKNDVRYVVLFYKTNRFSGTLRSSEEGEVFWISPCDIGKYTLADGFSEMLEAFMSKSPYEIYLFQENGSWKSRILK
ncbi:MAG: 8-oxo-dGTP diphosphatase [Eubacteriales bacterium]